MCLSSLVVFMKIPKPVQNLIDALQRLPGVGPKTAKRLTFYLLHVPEEEVDLLAKAVGELRDKTILCEKCFSVDEQSPCSICRDPSRDQSTICVVANPLDVLAVEATTNYKGLYHVLHGVISPVNHIGPEDLKISELIVRVKGSFAKDKNRHYGLDSESDGYGSRQILNPASSADRQVQDDVEGIPEPGSGELANDSGQGLEGGVPNAENGQRISEIILATNPSMEGESTAMYIKEEFESLNIKLTRIAKGLPVGGDLEYADQVTLSHAFEGRREL